MTLAPLLNASPAMIRLYLLPLVVTGLFALWPGRIMRAVVYGP
jgi:uncharacterized membrane protein